MRYSTRIDRLDRARLDKANCGSPRTYPVRRAVAEDHPMTTGVARIVDDDRAAGAPGRDRSEAPVARMRRHAEPPGRMDQAPRIRGQSFSKLGRIGRAGPTRAGQRGRQRRRGDWGNSPSGQQTDQSLYPNAGTSASNAERRRLGKSRFEARPLDIDRMSVPRRPGLPRRCRTRRALRTRSSTGAELAHGGLNTQQRLRAALGWMSGCRHPRCPCSTRAGSGRRSPLIRRCRTNGRAGPAGGARAHRAGGRHRFPGRGPAGSEEGTPGARTGRRSCPPAPCARIAR